jgi:hypothetical protein
MAETFFNFSNNETYHFFQWLRLRGPELVSKAFADLDADDLMDADLPSCYAAKDKLTVILNDIIDQTKQDADCDHDGCYFGEPGRGDDLRLLTGPLLEMALESLATWAVAEALLIDANKWAPDMGPRPESI